MPEQRQLGISFDSCTRAVGAMRRPALAVPIAVLLVAGALSLREGTGAAVPADALAEAAAPAHGAPAFANLFAPRHALPRLALPWESAPAVVHDGIAKPLPSQAATRPPLRLTPEQQKIAQFVAKKYRIAVGDVQHLVSYAYRAAKEFRLDPYLVLAVMSIESSFNPDARSSAGAQGLMQVLTRVHADKFAPFGGASAAFDPMANISVGSRILREYGARGQRRGRAEVLRGRGDARARFGLRLQGAVGARAHCGGGRWPADSGAAVEASGDGCRSRRRRFGRGGECAAFGAGRQSGHRAGSAAAAGSDGRAR
ncbi:MAG: transglycosylase SLT domain-containing protein [Burkholderiaceae bacterium]|nr:transglycosylase SLT domain-containing protein [Burkholderiaceae bacterium]